MNSPLGKVRRQVPNGPQLVLIGWNEVFAGAEGKMTILKGTKGPKDPLRPLGTW